MIRKAIPFVLIVVFIFLSSCPNPYGPNTTSLPNIPGWDGQLLISCMNLDNWSVEQGPGSSGTLELIDESEGKAVQLNWDIGAGDWVQAKYTFPSPVDLSQKDIFGLYLRGSESSANSFTIMFADTMGVFSGISPLDGINTITRWMTNISIPKKMFYKFWEDPPGNIDWSQINRMFIVIKRPNADEGGGSGSLAFKHIQADTAALWPRQDSFKTITSNNNYKYWVLKYIKSQQKSCGLFLSWKEETNPTASLYDQALVLIVLTMEGNWKDTVPINETAANADLLANFLISKQKPDGHWARSWNPVTEEELSDDQWVGDQGWCVLAMMTCYKKSLNPDALSSANKCADWLIPQINSDGSVVDSTDGNLDVWWAMKATGHNTEADKIKDFLLNNIWDNDLGYFWRGKNDPFIALDANTWGSEFARRVNHTEKGYAALSFIRKTLITVDDSNILLGLDGMGPVSIWCEGTAQFISAGGRNSQYFLDNLVPLQHSNGGMPGSSDEWYSNAFGWLTKWVGLAPTCWYYFAMTQSPFYSF